MSFVARRRAATQDRLRTAERQAAERRAKEAHDVGRSRTRTSGSLQRLYQEVGGGQARSPGRDRVAGPCRALPVSWTGAGSGGPQAAHQHGPGGVQPRLHDRASDRGRRQGRRHVEQPLRARRGVARLLAHRERASPFTAWTSTCCGMAAWPSTGTSSTSPNSWSRSARCPLRQAPLERSDDLVVGAGAVVGARGVRHQHTRAAFGVSWRYQDPAYTANVQLRRGAGDGNRTRVASLEGHASASTEPST